MGQQYATVNTDIKPRIKTWQEFRSLTEDRPSKLLERLHLFPNSILVTGCQRSGTTMLSEILLGSEGLVDFRVGEDSELDGALILSGLSDYAPTGRYCFQTTYLNECYTEYFDHSNFKMVWLLRNPASVVYSMLSNWQADALNRLFVGCGVPALSGFDRLLCQWRGPDSLSPLRRACWAYRGKTAQLSQLRRTLGSSNLAVLDYDELVGRKAELLPRLYSFLDVNYSPDYLKQIRSSSLTKKSQLTAAQLSVIERMCGPVYLQASALKTIT